MTTLLIGANGQVGRALAALADDDWVATTREGIDIGRMATTRLDVTDAAAVRELLARLRPTTVINATAYTAVDRAEGEPEAAFAVNAHAPMALARACAEVGSFLVHYSTDYVFDGTSDRPYTETDDVSPLGVYGRSKLEGERAVLEYAPHSLVIRTAWVYSTHGHNFLRTMLRLAAERPELRVVDDQVGTPTTADFIARATLALLSREPRPSGIVNVVCDGRTSWHGFASAIVRGAFERGLIGRDVPVVPISTAEFPAPARRPSYSVLATDRLKSLGIAPPSWQDELARRLDEMACIAPRHAR